MEKGQISEIKKLRAKQTTFQLQFPELFRSDVSIYPSYTNFKLPYFVVCRERQNSYRAYESMRKNMEISELSMRQLRAWDGVRLSRIFDMDEWGPKRKKVADLLTAKQRQRFYRIMSTKTSTQ